MGLVEADFVTVAVAVTVEVWRTDPLPDMEAVDVRELVTDPVEVLLIVGVRVKTLVLDCVTDLGGEAVEEALPVIDLVTTGLPVLARVDDTVFDALVVTLYDDVAVEDFERAMDADDVGEAVDVFDVDTEPVLVGVIRGVSVIGGEREGELLAVEVRDGCMLAVPVGLADELLLTLIERVPVGLAVPLFEDDTDPVEVLEASVLRVEVLLDVPVFVDVVETVRKVLAEGVFDGMAVTVALGVPGAVRVFKEVGDGSMLETDVGVARGLRVEDLEAVADIVGRTFTISRWRGARKNSALTRLLFGAFVMAQGVVAIPPIKNTRTDQRMYLV